MAMKRETLKDMAIFLDNDGKVQYNSKCKECSEKCKQSYKVKVISCTKYKDRKKTT